MMEFTLTDTTNEIGIEIDGKTIAGSYEVIRGISYGRRRHTRQQIDATRRPCQRGTSSPSVIARAARPVTAASSMLIEGLAR
jgi:hypothetical protein